MMQGGGLRILPSLYNDSSRPCFSLHGSYHQPAHMITQNNNTPFRLNGCHLMRVQGFSNAVPL